MDDAVAAFLVAEADIDDTHEQHIGEQFSGQLLWVTDSLNLAGSTQNTPARNTNSLESIHSASKPSRGHFWK